MQDCLAVLANSEHAEEDRASFVLAQFAFWLLAATDGHAKNFSIQHQRGGRFHMTALYDVLSAWPIIGDRASQIPYLRAKLAMGVKAGGMHYRLGQIQPQHWHRLAAAAGAGVWSRVVAMAESVEAVLPVGEAALPEKFPRKVWRSVAAGMTRHARAFLNGVPTAS
jgi:serine/threonine-protein kinase HipA